MVVTREHAQKILTENPNLISHDYFEAIINGTLPNYYLHRLEILKRCSDETPHGKLVDIWHPSYPFMKCRGNFIIGLSAPFKAA